jgi:hypothetical protein
MANTYNTKIFNEYCISNKVLPDCVSSYKTYCDNVKTYSEYSTYPLYYLDTDPRCVCTDSSQILNADFSGLTQAQISDLNNIAPCLSKECLKLKNEGNVALSYRDNRCSENQKDQCKDILGSYNNAKKNKDIQSFINSCKNLPDATCKLDTDCAPGFRCGFKKTCIQGIDFLPLIIFGVFAGIALVVIVVIYIFKL